MNAPPTSNDCIFFGEFSGVALFVEDDTLRLYSMRGAGKVSLPREAVDEVAALLKLAACCPYERGQLPVGSVGAVLVRPAQGGVSIEHGEEQLLVPAPKPFCTFLQLANATRAS